MIAPLRIATMRLATHRGVPRVWIEGKYLADAGLRPGERFRVRYGTGRVEIDLDPAGPRAISAKHNGAIPVIDIQNRQLASALAGASTLEVRVGERCVVIKPSRVNRKVAARVLSAAAVSLFAGGGLMAQAAGDAGFTPVAAVEIDPRYADIYAANHPTARVYNSSIEEVDFDEIAAMGPIGLLEAGIPCEAFSRARRLDRGGRQKRDNTLAPEAHENGDLTFWCLYAIDRINPHTAVIEQVETYLASGAGWILRHALSRMGYTVDARVVDPRDFGELTGRRRAVIVATSHPCVRWPAPRACARSMRDVLLAPDDPSCDWFDESTKPWLYEHWRRQTAKGNHFAAAVVRDSDRYCPTIKRRYWAGQGDNFVIAHPERPDLHRWLTIDEGKRLMGLADTYDLGEAKTVSGEIIGQGVHVGAIARIIRSAAGSPEPLPHGSRS